MNRKRIKLVKCLVHHRHSINFHLLSDDPFALLSIDFKIYYKYTQLVIWHRVRDNIKHTLKRHLLPQILRKVFLNAVEGRME